MTRSSCHEWRVRVLVTGIPRPAEYRVIATSSRVAIGKALEHVNKREAFVTVSARVIERHVDASAYQRDCELMPIPDSTRQEELRV